jgi:hypothetical protein
VIGCEEITKIQESEERVLFILDKKGIYNVTKKRYEVKQKKIQAFCHYKGRLIFQIEDNGIYEEDIEKKQLIKIKNVIDLKQEGEDLNVLGLSVKGRYEIVKYELEDEVKEKERIIIDKQSNKILGEKIYTTKENVMIIE